MLYILLVCIFLITYLLPNTIFIFFHLHIIIHDIIVIASFVSYNDERPTFAKPRIAIQSKHDLTSSGAYLRPHLQCLLILKNTKTSSDACPDSYSAASLPTHSSVKAPLKHMQDDPSHYVTIFDFLENTERR